MSNRSVLKLVLPIVLTVACGQSQGVKVRNARMAQIDAQAQAKMQAVDQRAQASGAEVDKEHAALGAAIDKSNQPGEGATEELVEVSKERAKYQTDAQARMDKLTIRLAATREKIDVLAAHAPTELHTNLQTATTEHDDLKQDVSKLGSVTPDSWGGTKDAIEQRMSTLDERLVKLNDAIGDV